MKNKCPICKKVFTGRTDKKYCSIKCKSIYNTKLNKVTFNACTQTDKILHRNRSILLEILGTNVQKKKINRMILDFKKFNFN